MVTLIQRGDRVSPFRRPPPGDVSGRSWQHLATLVRYKCVKTGEAQKESLTLHHLMPTRSSRFAGRSGDQDTGYRPAQSDLGATGPRLPEAASAVPTTAARSRTIGIGTDASDHSTEGRS